MLDILKDYDDIERPDTEKSLMIDEIDNLNDEIRDLEYQLDAQLDTLNENRDMMFSDIDKFDSVYVDVFYGYIQDIQEKKVDLKELQKQLKEMED